MKKRNELTLLNCRLYHGVWVKLRKINLQCPWLYLQIHVLRKRKLLTHPQKRRGSKEEEGAKTQIPVPAYQASFDFGCKLFRRKPKNLIKSQRWTSAHGLKHTLRMNPSCSGSPHLCVFLGLSSCSKKFVSFSFSLGRGLGSTCEKDQFLPPVCPDIHEEQPWLLWLPSITAGYCLLPAQVLTTSSQLHAQQGCCICNTFSTHWANELCVAKVACNFLMSLCFMAGNMLLPPTSCSSVKIVHHISLVCGSCYWENISTYQQHETPYQPCSYPRSLFV